MTQAKNINEVLINALKAQGMNGYVYGKAKTFFTLYKFEIHSDGNNEEVTYTFVKNIGKEHDNAYPVNENLHGRLVTERYDNEPIGEGYRFVEEYDYTMIRFGKYEGYHFNEVEDTDYLVWLSNNAYNKEDRSVERIECNKVILARDAKYKFYESKEGSLVVDTTHPVWKKVINNEPIDITFEKNCNNDDHIYIKGMGIPFEFCNTRPGRFAASVAQVECFDDDKARASRYYMIKGKPVRITKYEFIHDMPQYKGMCQVESKDVLYVKEWEFVK